MLDCGGPSSPAPAAKRAADEGRLSELDPLRDFSHDVPADTLQEALHMGKPRQAERPFGDPWPPEW